MLTACGSNQATPSPTRKPVEPGAHPRRFPAAGRLQQCGADGSGSLGSQTGGSTCRPAAYNGIVGVKATYGRISRYGVAPLSWSLDHVGILTRTVAEEDQAPSHVRRGFALADVGLSVEALRGGSRDVGDIQVEMVDGHVFGVLTIPFGKTDKLGQGEVGHVHLDTLVLLQEMAVACGRDPRTLWRYVRAMAVGDAAVARLYADLERFGDLSSYRQIAAS